MMRALSKMPVSVLSLRGSALRKRNVTGEPAPGGWPAVQLLSRGRRGGISPNALFSLSVALAWLSFSAPPAAAQPTNSSAYIFTTFAGNPVFGAADGVGGAAQFAHPEGVVADTNGNVYVADTLNGTVRKITLAGVVSTIAGFAGTFGSTDGTNGFARFDHPTGIAVDVRGSIYVADRGSSSVRRLTTVGTNWVVTTIAGQPGSQGTNDGVGSAARFNRPNGVAVDASNNVYVADTGNSTIRQLTPSGTNWMVSTIAVVDVAGASASLAQPYGVAVETCGAAYAVIGALAPGLPRD